MSGEITPFTVQVADADLADLADRLRRTRWPEPATVADWSQGVPLAYVQQLCRYWAEDYDWRKREARLNAWPQYRTEIDGLGIHFVHVPSPVDGALPLVMTHGWPGSVVEFLDVLGPLTDPGAHGGDPADAFSVVCPSLPGYAWSDRPSSPGWSVTRTGEAWAQLMARLGYDRYGAQGGDWGAMVTTALAQADPDHLAGIHLNMVIAGPDPADGELTDSESAALAAMTRYFDQESGYSTQQATRPQTLGYGLTDSPAGQCAWILEKFWAWSDAGDDPVAALGADRILDDVMLYWLPATATSSARLYWESFKHPPTGPVNVPMGASMFPKEIFRCSQRWAARQYRDIRHWGEPPRGGHFAAFEEPELFVDEVRRFFRTVR
ncbi:MAG: epoxide hydrolase [Actinomycetota bacterium]|nr:epoxide hydrolase [Actinomycetota bacterium]